MRTPQAQTPATAVRANAKASASTLLRRALAAALLGTLAACGMPHMGMSGAMSGAMDHPPMAVKNASEAPAVFGRITHIEVFQAQAPWHTVDMARPTGTDRATDARSAMGNATGHTAPAHHADASGAEKNESPNGSTHESRHAAEHGVAGGEHGQLRASVRVRVWLDSGDWWTCDTTSAGELRVGDRVKVERGQMWRQ